jgi:hypothetical protein
LHRAPARPRWIVPITVATGTINVWNRLAVSFRSQRPVDK